MPIEGFFGLRPQNDIYLDSLPAKVEAVIPHQTATVAKLDVLLPSILKKV